MEMRNFFAILFVCLISNLFVFAQDSDTQTQEYDDAADSIYLKCLYKHRHFISTNTLQFVVGTMNLNYEFRFANQYSLKVGAGSVLGYRILVEEHVIVAPGSRYFLVEPRFYTFSSTKNCWMQVGFALSYKNWDYNQRIADESTDVEDDYFEKHIQQHMLGASIVGKHPVSGGFTFEYQLGVDVGTLDEDSYVSPNFGFSMGWTL